MTEDPVKLYVVVMAILLCVLGFVAYTSYREASAYEQAIDDAPRQADMLREYASEVQQLCNQLSKSKMAKGEKSLIDEAARDNNIEHAGLGGPKNNRLQRGVIEKRYQFEFRKSGRSSPLPRDRIARLCRAVESYSQNILKTIEIQIFRHTGPNVPAPGRANTVDNDLYRGKLIFGVRVVDG